MRAGLIYQHATTARDRSIATAWTDLVATERSTTGKPDEANEVDSGEEDGPTGALVPVA